MELDKEEEKIIERLIDKYIKSSKKEMFKIDESFFNFTSNLIFTYFHITTILMLEDNQQHGKISKKKFKKYLKERRSSFSKLIKNVIKLFDKN